MSHLLCGLCGLTRNIFAQACLPLRQGRKSRGIIFCSCSSVAGLVLCMFLVFSGCAIKVDKKKAKALVESLLYDLKHEDYSSLDKYYTSSFDESETQSEKAEKFKQLRETMGAIKSYELISSKEVYDDDRGINQLELKYKVVCERVVVDETYLVIIDEGNEKITFQNIENSSK